MKFSNQDLGNVMGITRQTFAGYVERLTNQKKFKKKTPGYCYSKQEMKLLSQLLDFDYKEAIEQKKVS